MNREIVVKFTLNDEETAECADVCTELLVEDLLGASWASKCSPIVLFDSGELEKE